MSDERLENRNVDASRRALLAGAGAVGATIALAACGTEPDGSNGTPPPQGNGNQDNGDQDNSDRDNGDQDNGDQDSDALVSTDDVEVGSGVIVQGENVVVTQPSAGEFRGFSAICTHEGCLVSSVSNGTINCACHGSQYSIEDGSVVSAAFGADPSSQAPLPPVEIEVEGSGIRRA